MAGKVLVVVEMVFPELVGIVLEVSVVEAIVERVVVEALKLCRQQKIQQEHYLLSLRIRHTVLASSMLDPDSPRMEIGGPMRNAVQVLEEDQDPQFHAVEVKDGDVCSLQRLLGLRLGFPMMLLRQCVRRCGIWILIPGDILFCGRDYGVGCRGCGPNLGFWLRMILT